ncbi:MAG: SH3 domain-containing protein [bacterium]|nr:SH3 domain-containing protein [bacterium]
MRILHIIWLFVISSSLACSFLSETPLTEKPRTVKYTRWVSAQAGLLIREAPSTDAGKRGVIAYGESVAVLFVTDLEETIQGVRGRWNRIAHKGVKGYVFGGYLNTQPLPAYKPIPTELEVLQRLGELSGIRIPPMKLRFGEFEPANFSVVSTKRNELYMAVSIQPDGANCEFNSGAYNCFSLLGTVAGDYIYSDIAASTIGRVQQLDSDRALFSQSEAHGDGCDFWGSAEATVYILSEHRRVHRSSEVGESCPCTCETAGDGCACPVRRVENIQYTVDGRPAKESEEIINMFKMEP